MQTKWLNYVLIAVGTIVLVADTMVASFAQSNGNHSSETGVTVSFEFSARRLTLHEPVILTFKVTNGSPRVIKLDLGEDRKAGFSFTLTRPDGTTIKLPTYVPEGLSVFGAVLVQPGDSYVQNLLLNEWHDFAALGN